MTIEEYCVKYNIERKPTKGSIDTLTLILGENRYLDFTVSPVGEIVGLTEYHRRKDDPTRRCCGFIFFNIPEAQRYVVDKSSMWELVSWYPLEVSPSLQCRACGNHGFIKGGKWVEA